MALIDFPSYLELSFCTEDPLQKDMSDYIRKACSGL